MKEFFFFSCLTFVVLINGCESPHTEDASLKKNKEVSIRLIEAFDKGDINALDTLLTDDVVDHQLDTMYIKKMGKEGVKEMFKAFDRAVSSKLTTVHSIAVTGDTVMVFATTVGTWVDSMMGMPPTNNEIKFPGVDIFRMKDGKIAEHWGFIDIQAMAQFTQSPMMDTKKR